ncbi:MAG: rod shape-determining protein MreC [Candidatus Parcubacteria bacterium]|jgi:cell shape-determining protein MreC
MKNLLRKNEGRATRFLVATTVIVAALFIADLALGGLLRERIRAVMSGLYGAASAIESRVPLAYLFASRTALQQQVIQLRSEVEMLKEKAAAYDVLRADDASLREILHLASSTRALPTENGIAAPVTSSVRSSPYGTFLIGAGSLEGVRKDDFVVTSGGFLIGIISDAQAHRSVVSEVLAPGAHVEATLGGASLSFDGLGNGAGRTTISRDVDARMGDIAFAPIFSQQPIGLVGTIATSSAGASKEVYIELPVNVSALRYVYVIPRP